MIPDIWNYVLVFYSAKNDFCPIPAITAAYTFEKVIR